MHANPILVPKGDSFTTGVQDIMSKKASIDAMKENATVSALEQLSTTGINEFRAVSNPNVTQDIDLDKIASRSQDILSKYRNLSKEGQEKSKKTKEFIGGDNPTEKYDSNTMKETEKFMKPENTKVQKNDLNDLLAKAKNSLMNKLKQVQSLLGSAVHRNQKNRLTYLGDRIANDLAKISGMENAKWNNPEGKNYPDNDKDTVKFMKPENTKAIPNDLNTLLSKASLARWSRRVPDALSKKAKEEIDNTQSKNLEQAVTELKKNEQEYAKDIQMLGIAMGKSATINRIAKEDKETKEDNDKEDEEDEKGKKPEKKDEKKDEKKPAKKEDKKDDKKDSKKEDIKERMERMRKMITKRGPSKTDGPGVGSPEKPQIEDGEKSLKPMKDDLTAVLNIQNKKSASYWDVQDCSGNTILKFNGSQAFGKKIFDEWKNFASKEYGELLLAKIRTEGIEKIASLVNGEFHITKHAADIEDKAKKDKEAKEKKEKEGKEKKEKEEKEKKEKKEEKKDEKKAGLRRDAKASPEISKYFDKYLSKGDGAVKSFTSKFQERVNKNKATGTESVTAMLLKKQNRILKDKIAELESTIDESVQENTDLKDEKVLRAKAERALKLVDRMIDKKMIAVADKEEMVQKITCADEPGFAVIDDIVNKNASTIADVISKKASFGTLKAGIRNMIMIPDKNLPLRDKLTSMWMNKPKYAKLKEFKDKKMI